MRRPLLLALAIAAVTGCDLQSARVPAPDPVRPPDWVTVSGNSGVVLTLPPYIEVFDAQNAIFANEAPPPGETEIPIQIWAHGPNRDEHPIDGESLLAWVERRLDNPAKGVPSVTRVALPAGRGIRYDRVDSFGTPLAWRIVVFAIETPGGAAWLMIDGPPEAWAARAKDLERIAPLFRIL